ncbi:MAG: hypothetical protein HFK02_04605 [Clostridia bacterium]|jgi:sporulation protein YlmC with PRC-barrel domain|nr:hypothetical protein [Clostridia bacterium]
MEFTFSQLKQKDVINLSDGKNLGRVCDITVTFPENGFTGITVTGCKGFRFSKQELFIPVKNVVKVGEDAVLVKLSDGKPQPDCPPKHPPKCPPDHCPPPRDRRSYDEYE